MNERTIELYTQALESTYNKIGKEHAGKGFFEAAVAGTFAELIVRECNEVLRLVPYNSNIEFGDESIYQDAIRKHFGVEE